MNSWDDILFLSSFKRKEYSFFPFTLSAIFFFGADKCLFICTKMMKVCTEKNKISRCFLEKMMNFFSFIGIECYLLMSDVTNLNMCI